MEDPHREREAIAPDAHLRDYLYVVRRHLWVVLAAIILVGAGFFFRTSRQRPVYQANAQLIIERQIPNILTLREMMEYDTVDEQYYPTQYRILQSRSLAQSVIDRLRLAEHPEFARPPVKEGVTLSADQAASRASDLIDAFLGRLTIEPVRNTRLVNVGVRSYEPKLAALMANTLADIYIEQTVNQKTQVNRETGDWLSEQAAGARKKLEESEQALQSFNAENNIISLEQRQGLLVQQLESINAEIVRAHASRVELETADRQFRELKKPSAGLDGVWSVPRIMANSVVQGIRVELVQLETELANESKVLTAKHPKIIALTARIQAVRQKLSREIDLVAKGIRNEYDIALARERSLADELETQKRELQELNQKGVVYGGLKREMENNRQLFDLIMAGEKETGLMSGMKSNPIRILDRAEVPRRPISPNKTRTAGIALAAALLLGVALAFFLEYLDDTVKDPNDLVRWTHLAYLGAVPVLRPKDQQGNSRDLIVLKEPKSVFAEAYRAVRTSLLFSSPGNPPRVLLVTSPSPQEGKSVTSVNLAVTMALTENRVLLIDADLRKPRLHRVFELDNSCGLSNLVRGECDLERALQKSGSPGLTVMTSGPVPPDPSELLGSARMSKLLTTLKERFDHVIIDCSPITPVTDASVLAAQVDGVILLVKAGETRRHVLKHSCELLDDVQANVIGVVLNQIDRGKSPYYKSYHYYGAKPKWWAA